MTIVGYQFPRELVDPWESNTLLVDVRVIAREGTWEVVDPCLTTWEANHLVRLLSVLATRADLVANRSLGVSEPNVTVTARARPGEPSRVDLRACFALELRPPWVKAVAGGGTLCVDLDVDRADLARATTALRENLARFPQRGDDPTL